MNTFTFSLFSLSINSIRIAILVQIPVCVLIILVIATHLHNLFGHLKFFYFGQILIYLISILIIH